MDYWLEVIDTARGTDSVSLDLCKQVLHFAMARLLVLDYQRSVNEILGKAV